MHPGLRAPQLKPPAGAVRGAAPRAWARRAGIGLGAGLLLLLGNPAAALSGTDYPQVEANPPIAAPSAPSCTVQVMAHDFAFSYGAPYLGGFAPPAACPAPWSKIVLTFRAGVSGVQFDRLVDAYFGKVLLYSGSTSEPCCTPAASTPALSEPGATTRWSVQKDVTEYASVLQSAQPVEVDLNNVQDSTYTGTYHATLALTFYETGPGAPAGEHPDAVVPLNHAGSSGVDGYLTPDSGGNLPAAAVTFPRNLSQLRAELFAQGHGPCEEFWWSEPSGCGSGTSYREVAIYVDGRLAGAAPVYPAVFTGADGPGFWEPIPSPRAWNLTPYEVDLTPLVGTLTDGAPHAVGLHLFDIDLTPGDYWLVQANLLEWRAAAASPTVGGLLSASGPAAPVEAGGWDPSGNALYQDQAEHSLSLTGWIAIPGGRRVTRVDDAMSASTTESAATIQTRWSWRAVTSTVTTRGGRSVSSQRSSARQFSIENVALTQFAFTDAGQDRTPAGWSSYDESMTTADATGIVYNGAERESYAASDSSGLCYDRTLTSAAGQIVADQADAACPPAPAP